ncbi:hypothetical protein [Streptomyces flaveolus]|uniref:hypothetical protein n=1 Tax=Streptomyces flaveolus TaxID=67297 RepID=UPI0036FD1154
MSETWIIADDGRDDGTDRLPLSSPPIDCYVLDDVTENDWADVICERPCNDPHCDCDGCSDERFRVRDAFIGSDQPLMAQSVALDHLGEPLLWVSLGPFEHPDDLTRVFYGVDLSYSLTYSHQDCRSLWAYTSTHEAAVDLYESIARSPGIANFLGWDESDVPTAPLRQAGSYGPGDGTSPMAGLKIVPS